MFDLTPCVKKINKYDCFNCLLKKDPAPVLAIAKDVVADTTKIKPVHIKDVPKNVLDCQCPNITDKNARCICQYLGCPGSAPTSCMNYVVHCLETA